MDAIHPEFRQGGKRIYYFAKTEKDSLFQLRSVNPDGGGRKILTHLVYSSEKLPQLSDDESFVVYEKFRRDSGGFLPYHPRLRKFYSDSILKAAANAPRKLVDLYRFDLAGGAETRLTATGNAHLLGLFDLSQAVYYYALEDSIFYLDPVTLTPVRRIVRFFSLSLFGQNREEVRLLTSILPSPNRKRALLTEVVSDPADRDFNRFRYFLIDSLTNKYLLVWSGGNAAYNQGRPPQTEWLDDRRFLTKVIKTKGYVEEGHSNDLRSISDSAAVFFEHQGEVWEIDVARQKAKKLSLVDPDFDFTLSSDRHFLFVVYQERQAEVVARINTVTRRFEEIARITNGKIADLAPDLEGKRLLFTLQDERGKGTVYLADLRQPKWKTSPSNPSP